ncbi:MAG TPA: hypothetical protein VKE22_13140 [Haliangiales bacterium]|nr:hypothetical protein [Haliangiales bacterium]
MLTLTSYLAVRRDWYGVLAPAGGELYWTTCARVRAGAMVGTNGPIVRAHLEGAGDAAAGPGETLHSTTGHVTLVVTVDAARGSPSTRCA